MQIEVTQITKPLLKQWLVLQNKPKNRRNNKDLILETTASKDTLGILRLSLGKNI